MIQYPEETHKMPAYTLGKIAKIVQGELYGDKNLLIENLLTDSRNVFNPEKSLFLAISGKNHDGHNFVPALQKAGVRCFITEKDISSQSNYIKVQSTIRTLQQLAAFHRKQFSVPITGITGSNGKTIVKEWLYQLLQPDKRITRSPKSYNSQTGVPLSVWLMDEHTELALFEAGISLPGEMEKLQAVIQPTSGIFTNIGEAHQENFTSTEEKVSEKLKLFHNVETLIYCRDYEAIREQIANSRQLNNTRLVTWSLQNKADLQVNSLKKKAGLTEITAVYQEKNIRFSFPFTDDASVENLLHCALFMLDAGYSPEVITERMKRLSPVAMRMEIKQGINQCTIINDAYNADINSLNIALDFLNQQRQHPVKTLILSDILQSGKPDKVLCREISAIIGGKNIHRFIGIGEVLKKHAAVFGKGEFFSTTEEFLENLPLFSFFNEAILLKGARTFRFEEISRRLELKAHTTILEINLNAMVHNLNYFRSLLKPETKIMTMVKAFSYGSGLYEIASLLQHQRVDYLGVAFTDEGVELRKGGITLPVMVMSPEEHHFDQLVEHNLEPEIYSFRILESFIALLKANKMKDYPVHLKFNTGMNRLGFEPGELEKLVEIVKQSEEIYIQSVFSHLAAADEPGHDRFTIQQIDKFRDIAVKMEQALQNKIIKHLLNTSGIERFTEHQFDMVRLGIGLYGISPQSPEKLQNISALKTRITQVKTIKKGETIGYGRKGKAKTDTVIAVIPVGYADGYSRVFSNGTGYFLINGKIAPIIGNVCMDMCFADITNVNAQEGDEVVIFGDDLPVTELAKQAGTIPYEILANISRRVKRVYVQE